MHDGGRLMAPMHQLPESEAGTLRRVGARHVELVCGTEVFTIRRIVGPLRDAAFTTVEEAKACAQEHHDELNR